MTGVLPMFPERRKRQHAFVLEPILTFQNENPSLGKEQVAPTNHHQPPPSLKPILTFPKGRNKLLLQITISPHLASPVGEGQIHLTG